MKVAKIVGGGCLGLVVLFGLVIGVVFYATSGITDTADNFFAAVADGEYEAAQEFTSQRLRETNSPSDLEEFVEANRIGNVTDTSWSNRSIENNTGQVTGTVETASGAVIPMTILFVSEGDDWRIDGFDIDAPGLNGGGSNEGASAPPSRGEREASALIDPDALAASSESGVSTHFWLDSAWIENDYFMFSTVWKDRPSAASLAERYAPEGLSTDEIVAIERAAAEVESAKFDEEGRLVVGYIRTIPSRTVRTIFTYERVEGATRPWQIVDLEVVNTPT